MAEESVNELNERLKSNNVSDLVVEHTRFRPNIFVTGNVLLTLFGEGVQSHL